MSFITFRRYYLDNALSYIDFYGKVLDVGGKRINKRGEFRPPLDKVESWEYLNIDSSTNPDYLCSADAIPVANNNFDIILMTEVLEHLENPEAVLKECYRVLKQGGVMIATIPFLYPIHADPHDYQRWTSEKLKMECQKAEFIGVVVKPMGGFFAVLYDLLYVSLGVASKNRNALKNRIVIKFVMPSLSKVFIWLDRKSYYKSNIITTGYCVCAEK